MNTFPVGREAAPSVTKVAGVTEPEGDVSPLSSSQSSPSSVPVPVGVGSQSSPSSVLSGVPVGVGSGSSQSSSPLSTSGSEVLVDLVAEAVLVGLPDPSGPPCTPVATNRAFASLCESHARLVPGLLTSGRAKQVVPAAHGDKTHFPATH